MFKLLKESKKSSARLGRIKTIHGEIQTPFFMPDATRGFVKSIDNQELAAVGQEAMVINTLHLYLQPTIKIIKKAGGVHKFMNWPGLLLSDSGGFQVYSLIHQNKEMGKVNDNGVVFKFPLDGSKHILTPEKSIQIQFDLGADMMVCFDDCPPNNFTIKDLEKSVTRTIVWAKRCRQEFDKQIKKRKLTGLSKPLLFSVIQGGAELDLRKRCTEALIKIGFDGYGFGARPVDKKGRFLGEVLKFTADLIPKNALRFALGIGLPEDILRCVQMGWDMFDCVIPTREARHGRLYLWQNSKSQILNSKQFSKFKIQNSKFYKTINISNSKYKSDFTPINGTNLKNYSKAYLHHLFRAGDPLAMRLATLNNLNFYSTLMSNIRQEINKVR
ncbi:tRNA guanosine(34) transglycosylase Tgt [Candidatus Falkowbacteria bacterium]|nr:tRNA guanosine(34) transglycosylase Tgt [Candidatus Falkowbacteria bacterium]